MENWKCLTSEENKDVWNKIDVQFNFNPSTTKFPSFTVPSPFITYDVSTFPNDKDLNDLEEKSLNVFQQLIQNNEYMYALDWQHPGYWINPYLNFQKDEFGEWIVPIFPDGDYYFFIQKDFKWGYLGHPWEKSITIFGEELINMFNRNKPIIFDKILLQK